MLNMAFELNGKKYRCNSDAFKMVKSAASEADELGHDAAVKAALWFGLEFGSIAEMTKAECIRFHRQQDVV